MISFYPGPSQVYPEVKEFMCEAMDKGILSINHRSPTFVDMSRKTIKLLKQKLDIPKDYTIFFTSSATECWEILSESFIDQSFFHAYNGAFGEKWMKYRHKLSEQTDGLKFPLHKELGINKLLTTSAKDADIICLTSNETSNATKIRNQLITDIRKRFRKALIFVDATSSMAGIEHPWRSADVWYSSVQKCFGLPAGMAIMVCSPKAIQRAKELNHNLHYNSMVFMAEQMQNWQTTYTPNVLNIFLLMKVMEMRPHIKDISRQLKYRIKQVNDTLISAGYDVLVPFEKLRSDTVTAIKAEESRVALVKEKALKEGFLLGNGYGAWKQNTFRIANFPAIKDTDIDDLLGLLKQF